jgi:very-short-patch-repair endonuclease
MNKHHQPPKSPEHHLHDEGRSDMREDSGITVIRFTNEQIMNEIDYTVQMVGR